MNVILQLFCFKFKLVVGIDWVVASMEARHLLEANSLGACFISSATSFQFLDHKFQLKIVLIKS